MLSLAAHALERWQQLPRAVNNRQEPGCCERLISLAKDEVTGNGQFRSNEACLHFQLLERRQSFLSSPPRGTEGLLLIIRNRVHTFMEKRLS